MSASLLSPPGPFRLRPMALADLDAVSAIEADSFPTPWPREGYEREITRNERATYFVLTAHRPPAAERVVGYAGYWLVAGEAHVSIIAVDPAWRGHGLGELLLLQLLRHARAAGALLALLEVREGNAVAQALYHKYGFAVVGRRQGYYKDTGEDALLMTVTWEEDQGCGERLALNQEGLWQRLRQIR